MLNLNRLYAFVTVGKHLSFTKAAEECCIVQTAISRQISALEKEMNVVLLERNNREVKLTPAGEIFYKEATEILQKCDRAVAKAQKADERAHKQLKIGIGQYEGKFVIEILKEFSALYPEVKITVSQLPYKALVDSLKNRSLDIIFAISYATREIDRQEISILELFTAESCIICSANSIFMDTQVVKRSDLLKKNRITLAENDGPLSIEHVVALNYKYDVDLPRNKIIQANSLESLYLMVGADLGFAFVPKFLQEDLPDGVVMKQVEEPVGKDIFVVMSNIHSDNPALQLFYDVVQDTDMREKFSV